jgi:hypothetical protein
MAAARQAWPAAMNATTTAAQQAGPLARQAVPLAKSAGMSVRESADEAIAWATPYADAARTWAAPRLEESAVAISENIAPAISGALMSAARHVDPSHGRSRRRRGRASLLAAGLLLIAAGAAAAMAMLRNGHSDDLGHTAGDPASGQEKSGPGKSGNGSARVMGDADSAGPDAGANGGSSRIT